MHVQRSNSWHRAWESRVSHAFASYYSETGQDDDDDEDDADESYFAVPALQAPIRIVEPRTLSDPRHKCRMYGLRIFFADAYNIRRFKPVLPTIMEE